MKLTDERIIAAPPATVWTAILDPEVLKACIPGCESMTGSPEDGFEAVVVQKVGPVKARFTGIVTLTDILPGEAVTISGDGKGGVAGFAKGGARVTLRPDETGERTMLAYDVDANVGGKIAQLGSRVIDSFAKKFADDFFQRFQTAVEEPAEAEDMPAAVAVGETEPAARRTGWLKRLTGG
ncbi:SRPBCC family protein [Frigidibacter oleivorans]|uniref:SRPBCC family protein n=1 Tax=Frigidibacter oleivorans TaxID=2487129 RepID=UPI000F8D5BC4|nr:carbon monoxide dehydrogenase subunit G [Frigidibacter oleivorans]